MIRRPLFGVNLDAAFDDCVHFNEHGSIPLGCALDKIRETCFPEFGERTALNMIFVEKEIYRELAFRYMNEVS